MTSFKRWFGAGAIVLVALALVACPAVTPKTSVPLPDISFDHGEGAKKVDLSLYFSDTDNGTYKATSDDTDVATVSVSGSTLTVTPAGPGDATVTVTVTASNGRTATQSFDVEVADPPPPPANNAPEMRTINNLSLDVGETEEIDLADYASDADAGDTLVYGAGSLNPAVATVSPTGAPISGSMITITAVSDGEATIAVGVTDGKSPEVRRTFIVMVTAPAPDNRPPVLLTSNLIPHVVYSDFRIGATKPYDLSKNFQDPDADTLVYGATSEHPTIASIDGLDVNTGMFTLTAVGKGNTSVTVMATDPDGESAQQTFNVGVGSKPPMATTASKDVILRLGMEGQTSRTLNLNDYFTDDLGETLDYELVSNTGEMYATAALDDSMTMLTITAAMPGSATVTVSAEDSDNDPVNLEFAVTVHAAPATPNNPPMRNDMAAPTVSLVLEDNPESDEFDASDYFTDADGDDLMYDTESDMEAVATVSDPGDGSMFTITAVGAGSATITVTASDGNDDGDATLEIMVKVTDPGNMKPRMKKMLEPLMIQIVADADATDYTGTGGEQQQADVTAAGTADNKSINLSEHFEDPDGVLLFFKVTKTETPAEDDEKPVIDIHTDAAMPDSTTATDARPAMGKEPDGTDDDENMIVIEPRNPGTAVVTVVAIDIGRKEVEGTFTVKVVGPDHNTGPSVNPNSPPAIPNLSGAASVTETVTDTDADGTVKRLTIEESRTLTVFKEANYDDHFTDPNFNIDDMLTLSVKYFAGDTSFAGTGVATHDELVATDALDPEKAGVRASVPDSPWGGNPNAKFTLTLTGVKGTDNTTTGEEGNIVALVATDMYGRMVARTFRVLVNNDPKAEGDQANATPKADPKTLGDETEYQNITAPAEAAVTDTVPLVVEFGGYFSDGDGPTDLADGTARTGAGCVIKATGGDTKVADFAITETGAGVTSMTITPKEIGTKTVTIACMDSFGRESDSDTLTVRVTGKLSGSRQ